jgi:hypothetical protein
MSEPKAKKGKHIPSPIRDGVLRDLSAKPKPLPAGELDTIASRWHVTKAAVVAIQSRNSEEINSLRAIIAERNLVIASKAQDRLLSELHNENAEASIKDLAFTVKAAGDSAVALLDGNERAVVAPNFGDLKRTIKALATWRESKVITVEAQP